MKKKILEATKNILKKNMEITKIPFCDKKIVLVYDRDSTLSVLVGEAYEQNLVGVKKSQTIIFDEETDKKKLQDLLMSLEENSTVILVQSTNFRLDGFRIRLNLKNIGVGCLEHNHLGYMSSDQVENYIDALEYKTPYYEALSDFMKEKIDASDTLVMRTRDGNELKVEGGFDSVKRNTGDYTDKYRGGTFPVGENFTEAAIFDNVNGSFSIYAYPDMNFQVQFCEPFVVRIEKSLMSCNDSRCPQGFRDLLNKIADGEDGEVMVRELGFGMNTGISKLKQLSDVSSFERVSGFHMSLGKKHQIYRKKIHRKVTQRFHIDIFPDVESIAFDGDTVYQNGKYLFTE